MGAGGMGEVFRARDTQLKREVALKVLPAALAADPDRLARFQREAEILASLNHPKIGHPHGVKGRQPRRAAARRRAPRVRRTGMTKEVKAGGPVRTS